MNAAVGVSSRGRFFLLMLDWKVMLWDCDLV
jgi:hypothetical protein